MRRNRQPTSRPQGLLSAARALRRRETASEALLWQALRGRQLAGLKFRRQQPIGPYVVDFFCPQMRLVIEIDGGVHDDRVEADAVRQQALEAFGLQVVRIPALIVERDCAAAMTWLSAQINARTVSGPPSPFTGEGDGG